jgi:ribonuclease Z
VHGVDLLYHETTYSTREAMFAKGRGHSTTVEAAKVAAKAGVGRLLIGHFSSRYKELEPLLEEAREIFPATEIAEEGKTYLVEDIRKAE